MTRNDRTETEESEWMKPCADCVFRNSEDGCALGCSLLLIWTEVEKIKG